LEAVFKEFFWGDIMIAEQQVKTQNEK
jgi:hypothetical protein